MGILIRDFLGVYRAQIIGCEGPNISNIIVFGPLPIIWVLGIISRGCQRVTSGLYRVSIGFGGFGGFL